MGGVGAGVRSWSGFGLCDVDERWKEEDQKALRYYVLKLSRVL